MSSPAPTNAPPFTTTTTTIDNADDENYQYTINPKEMVHTIITSIADTLHELRAQHAPTLLPPTPTGPNPLGPIGAPPINLPYRPLSPSAFATPASFFTLSAAVHEDDEEIRTAPAFRNARRLPPAPFCVSSSRKKEDGDEREREGFGLDGTADSAGPVAAPAPPLAPAAVLLPVSALAAVVPVPVVPFAPALDPATADLRARQILAYQQHTGQEPWLVACRRQNARRERGRHINRLKRGINGWRGRWGPVQTGMQQRLEELLFLQRWDG
ncbi:MAG: hypothetical protein LQ339_004775 [Xanthoria mediterranea]|nr:MAG: hypothetical protein LQ339_004775 [Xanthoria mediterranea]